MSRTVEEWIGKTDDTPVPDRVKLRVLKKFDRICQCGCGKTIRPGDGWRCDHKIAIINSGENRESNLQPLLLKCDIEVKLPADLAEKKASYKTQKSHYRIKRAKGRPMPGTKASGLRKRMNGKVEKW